MLAAFMLAAAVVARTRQLVEEGSFHLSTVSRGVHYQSEAAPIYDCQSVSHYTILLAGCRELMAHTFTLNESRPVSLTLKSTSESTVSDIPAVTRWSKRVGHALPSPC